MFSRNFTIRTLLSGLFIALFVIVTSSVTWADEPVSEAKKFFDAMSPEQFSDPIALDDFIRRFPDSDEARIAFAFRYSLLEKLPTIEGYNEFIKKYPDKLQAQLAIQEVFKLYRYQNRVSGYYDFVKRYPNTQQALVAMLRIQELMFEYVCKLDKEEEYDAFISAFPDAPQVPLALEKAKQKVIDIEQEKLKANNDNLDPYLNKKITDWERSVNSYRRQYPKIDSGVTQIEARIKLYKIHRIAEVLQIVYGAYSSVSRVQNTLNSLSIEDRLDRINQTLQDNHKELLAKLEAESDKICKVLQEESARICKGLAQLHQDNVLIIQEIHTGFDQLHKDFVEVNTQLNKVCLELNKLNSNVVNLQNAVVKSIETSNKLLAQMDNHLEQVNHNLITVNQSITKGFQETNKTLNQNFATLNNTVKQGFAVQTQVLQNMNQNIVNGFNQTNQAITKLNTEVHNGFDKQAQLTKNMNQNMLLGFSNTNKAIDNLNTNVRMGFEAQEKLAQLSLVELRSQSQQLTDLSEIAIGGFERVGNIWESQRSEKQYVQMNQRFDVVEHDTQTKDSWIGKSLGTIASGLTSFVPYVGPSLAPIAYKIGESVGDFGTQVVTDTILPCAQDVVAGLVNGENPTVLQEKCQQAARKIWNDSADAISQTLPVIWEQGKYAIVNAAQSLANQVSIPEDLSRPILAAACEGDLSKAVDVVAEYIGVSADALRFAADYII